MATKKPSAAPPAPQIPLLNMDTLAHRAFVKIDGEAYDLRTHAEFGLVNYRRVQRWGQELDALWALDELTADQEAEVQRLLDNICEKVLVAPPEVLTKLSDVHQMAIARAFTLLPRPFLPVAGAVGAEARRGARPNSITASSSLG